ALERFSLCPLRLLAQPEIAALARRLTAACLDDPTEGHVDALRLPENPDDPLDWTEATFGTDVPLTQGQTATVIGALCHVYSKGVEKPVDFPFPPEGAPQADLNRAVRWKLIRDGVEKLGEYALPWFERQLLCFERDLATARAQDNAP